MYDYLCVFLKRSTATGIRGPTGAHVAQLAEMDFRLEKEPAQIPNPPSRDWIVLEIQPIRHHAIRCPVVSLFRFPLTLDTTHRVFEY